MKSRLLIFHPIIAPYRIDLFNALSDAFDTKIVLFWRNLKDQTFDYSKIEAQMNFTPQYLVRDEIGTYEWLMSIKRIINKFKPDIVIGNEFGAFMIPAIIYKRFAPKNYKVISFVDDSYNMVADSNQLSVKHKLATKAIAPILDEIINVEPRVTKWYQTHFGKGLYFPIICNDDRARQRQKRVLPYSEHFIKKYNLKGKKVLLFVGRLVVLKNIDFAITAFLKAKINDSVFIIVGTGEEEEKLKVLIKKFDNVIMVGRYEGEELYAWYNVAQVFTLPSILEPFGAVTNEALVAGCKALISKNAGSNCLVKDGANGYVIDPSDANGYINSLQKVMDEVQPLTLPLKLKENQMHELFKESIIRLVDRLNNMLLS